ncbi:hypothetical protein GQ42DRAFT_171441, partial [Ramicandelaber brevisporus]
MKVLLIATAVFASLAVACQTNADCEGLGFTSPTCDNDKCYDMNCKNNDDSHCPPGTKCLGSVCFPYLAEMGEHCDMHDNCVNNLWCSDNKCAAQKSVGSACKDNEECDGYLRKMEPGLEITAKCQNGSCKLLDGGRSSAEDCADGFSCKPIKDDGSEKICTKGNAVGDKCSGNTQCVDKLMCYNGHCAEGKYKKPGDSCESNSECQYYCGHDKKCSGPPGGV